ncbi:hypothetical protein EV122DRAFT_171753, partial [Schizophyllum commune]
MPSTSLQSRINAFENISKSPTRPQVPAKPNLLSEIPSSRSGSPPAVDRKTSLIDLKDWVLDDGLPSPSPVQTYKVYEPKKAPPKSGLLINLESPTSTTNGKAPPLPPRKPSFASLKSVSSASSAKPAQGAPAEHTYPPGKLDVPQKSSGHAPTSSVSSFHSVSLSEDTDLASSPSPSSSSQYIATYPVDLAGSEADSASLGGESFEDVAASSYGSPTSAALIARDWDKARAMQKSAPPKLPQRPSAAASAAAAAAAAASASTPRLPSLKMPPPPPVATSPSPSSPSSPYVISPASTSSVVTAIGRRAPPPAPPSRSSTSDRTSILSTATESSPHCAGPSKPVLSWPTPVPPAARARYETVFNVVQSRKGKPTPLSAARGAAGWRGLPVEGEDG